MPIGDWLWQTKAGRHMRTNQLHLQDSHRASTTLFTLWFEAMKAMAGKRVSPVRPQLSGGVGAKNANHLAVLAENGINYDRPMSPVQVATLRAERIAREKKNVAAAGTANVCRQQRDYYLRTCRQQRDYYLRTCRQQRDYYLRTCRQQRDYYLCTCRQQRDYYLRTCSIVITYSCTVITYIALRLSIQRR